MITIPAEITGIKRLKNKTVNIGLNTHELTPDQFAGLMVLEDYCIVALKAVDFTPDEVKSLDDVESPFKTKTPSQKLRDVLFIAFKQDPEGYDTFNKYYNYKMNNFIENIKRDLV